MTSSFSYDLLLTAGRNILRSPTTNIFWAPTLPTQKIAASAGKIFGISETHSSTRFTLEYDIARPHWVLRCLLSMSRATLWTFLTSLSLSSLSKMMRRIISMCTASSLNTGSRCTWIVNGESKSLFKDKESPPSALSSLDPLQENAPAFQTHSLVLANPCPVIENFESSFELSQQYL